MHAFCHRMKQASFSSARALNALSSSTKFTAEDPRCASDFVLCGGPQGAQIPPSKMYGYAMIHAFERSHSGVALMDSPSLWLGLTGMTNRRQMSGSSSYVFAYHSMRRGNDLTSCGLRD